MGQCVKRHVKGGDPSPFLSSMTQRIWQFMVENLLTKEEWLKNTTKKKYPVKIYFLSNSTLFNPLKINYKCHKTRVVRS